MFLLRKLFINIIIVVTLFSNPFNRKVYVDKNLDDATSTLIEAYKSDYIGHLIIDKINLNIGFYDKNNILNDIDYGLELLKTSIMPDNDDYIVFLASHSGDSNISHFKKLYELQIDDQVMLEYNNKDYNYKVFKKYIIDKTGLFNINIVPSNSLVLITCIKGTDKQLIIICK